LPGKDGTFLITREQLEEFGTRVGFSRGFYIGSSEIEKNRTVAEVNRVLKAYEINTSIRIAFFMGQVAYETEFGRLPLERFRYSPPEAYFNDIYGGRADLGNIPGTNDGELFRGAGFLHLTGRYNYDRFADHVKDQSILTLGYRLVGGTYNKPFGEMVSGEFGHIDVGRYAWESAGWFWRYGAFNSAGTIHINLNLQADARAIGEITRAITGSYTTVGMRTTYTRDMYRVLTGGALGI
jgi:hypothetical protein